MWSQTLGAVNNNISAIPMPASTMKRKSSVSNMHGAGQFPTNHARSQSGSRMSLAGGRPAQPIFQRSSSGTNLADMGLQSVQRHSTSNVFASAGGARKSLAPNSIFQTPAPSSSMDQTQRRSSVFKARPSHGPGQGGAKQSFFATGPVPSAPPADPRRLKDPSTRQQMAHELMEYLSNHNFENEARHQLTGKSMTSPMQKDFNTMFQWLYKRIDPGYKWQKSVEQELPILLKQMRYPFEKSISKSAIAAVGSQNNWPIFLGLLHWMMQLVRMVEAYETGQYDDACFEAGYDVSPDRIIFEFLSGAYGSWLDADDEEDDQEAQARLVQPHIERMAARFEEANSQHNEQVMILEAEHQAIQDQIKEFGKTETQIAELDDRIKLMEEDLGNLAPWIENQEARIKRHTARCDLFNKTIEEIEAELEILEKERQELNDVISSQGITISDIDRMAAEKERLESSLQTAAGRIEESKKRVAEKELAASRKLDELEQTIERFNNLGYQIGVIPSTAPNAKGLDYELILTINEGPNFTSSQMGASTQDSDRLLSEPGTGYSPHHLLNLDLRGTVKSNILALRRDIAERRNAALEADMNNHDLLDKIKEAMDEKQSEVEALGHKVAQAEEELDKLREITSTQKTASDAQIEKMEKELGRMRSNLGESVQLMVQREMAVNIE